VSCIENRTFDEIAVGTEARATRTLTQRDMELFTVLVGGEQHPEQTEEVYATADILQQMLAPSLWGGALFSWVVGAHLLGPGCLLCDQRLRIHRSLAVGDTLQATVKVVSKDADDHSLTLDCLAVNQDGDPVLRGAVRVIAPTVKICSPPAELPIVYFGERGARHKKLVEMTAALAPAVTGVVHPVDTVALDGAIRAAEANLIQPVLIGPVGKIRAAAKAAHIQLTPYELIDVPHSHAAAAKAVELTHAGQLTLLMKGSLHTDELMSEIVRREGGLRTERRLSHVYVIDVPTYPKPLLITDAAINIFPDVLEKRDIVQNAIDLAQVMGVATPKVAILSAVETVTPKLQATMDAAALCKMAERGQIQGGILDGPLALDNAISLQAARTKGIVSAVAGDADILLAPDLEAGNMIAKQLEYLANATAAGIVLGAQVPIVLTSRADGLLTRLASCAVAVLLAQHRQAAVPGASGRHPEN